MLLKFVFFLAFASTNLVLAAEILSRLQADSSEMNSIANSVSSSIEECISSPSATEAKIADAIEEAFTSETEVSTENQSNEASNLPMTPESPDPPKTPETDNPTSGSDESRDLLSDEVRSMSQENSRPNDFAMLLDSPASSSFSNPGLLGKIDRLRQTDNHEDGKAILHIIDPYSSPQTQLVDNTLRFMMIKSSVDEMASRIFPNLHVLHHMIEDHQ